MSLKYPLPTENFAHNNQVQAQSVRKRYAATGSYHGVRPVKLANRRLAWPDVVVTMRGAIAANDNASAAADDNQADDVGRIAELKSKVGKGGRHD